MGVMLEHLLTQHRGEIASLALLHQRVVAEEEIKLTAPRVVVAAAVLTMLLALVLVILHRHPHLKVIRVVQEWPVLGVALAEEQEALVEVVLGRILAV